MDASQFLYMFLCYLPCSWKQAKHEVFGELEGLFSVKTFISDNIKVVVEDWLKQVLLVPLYEGTNLGLKLW